MLFYIQFNSKLLVKRQKEWNKVKFSVIILCCVSVCVLIMCVCDDYVCVCDDYLSISFLFSPPLPSSPLNLSSLSTRSYTQTVTFSSLSLSLSLSYPLQLLGEMGSTTLVSPE